MIQHNYTYSFVNKRVTVIVKNGDVTVDSVSRDDRSVVEIPKVVEENLKDLMNVVAVKTFKYLVSAIKRHGRLDALTGSMPNLVNVLFIDGMKFDFNFRATFCSDGENEGIAGYSLCSVSDLYGKGSGKSRSAKRLVAAKSVLENGKSGKLYHVKGIISREGINKIIAGVCEV